MRRFLTHLAIAAAGLAATLFLGDRQMLLSGLTLTPGDFSDARFINVLLEHSYRWLLREPLHLDLWSPPFLYPLRNTGAYSDLLVSAGPFYWCWRAVGLAPDSSFQLWLLTMAALNYLSMYAFLRVVFRVGPLAAATGGALFAVGGCRLLMVYQPHLTAHFFTIVSLIGWGRFFAEAAAASDRSWRPGAWLGVGMIFAVLQLYASFYLGWFLGLALAAGVGVAVVRGDGRRLAAALWRRRWAVLGWGAASAALLYPLAAHYLAAAGALGGRSWLDVAGLLPRPWEWFLVKDDSWLYGAALGRLGAAGLPSRNPLGVGLATTTLAVVGLWSGRKARAAAVVLWTAAALVVVSTTFNHYPPYYTLWYICYYGVPGAAVVRVPFRICLIVLIGVAVGVALFLNTYGRRPVALTAALALFCVLEQGEGTLTFVHREDRRDAMFSNAESRERIRRVVERIPPGCACFLYSPSGDPTDWHEESEVSVDAMWAAVQTGTPTLNGYPSKAPRDWPFLTPQVRTRADRAAVEAKLQTWCALNGVDPATVARVYDEPEE
jgi:hypothetical protein